jgi:TPR repeat protein
MLVGLNARAQKPTPASDPAFQELKAQAEKGFPEAQFSLGLKYFESGNFEEAANWYRKASEQGLDYAQVTLGAAYFLGQGVPKDYVEAVRWWRKAADQGLAEAQCHLGYSYALGQGVPLDYIEAYKWFYLAASKGNKDASKDRDDEASLLTPDQIAEGQRRAASQLQSQTSAKDPTLQELKAQAEKGDPEAQFGLGWKCEQDNDFASAARWYFMAADHGHAGAQNNLGMMYTNGKGVSQDFAEAAKLFRKAADQGLPHAQLNLANAYAMGRGVAHDSSEAAQWWRKAADKGIADAQFNLGLAYFNGDGVSQDYIEAIKWYRKAADQGYAPAQTNLGSMYQNGQGVPQDYVEAFKWYTLAASQGNAIASTNRNSIASRMTSDQIAEGQRRAAAPIQNQAPATKTEKPIVTPSVQPNPRQETQPSIQSSGTGFFITADGYLLTNYHVVEKAARIVVRVKEETYEARVVTTDPANDIALLKVSGTFKALPIASSRSVRLGDSVFTIGFPNPEIQGVEAKLTKGEINSLAGVQDDPHYFQISVPLQPGNSGGPLVNQAGNVVGIVAARLDDLKALKSSGSLPQNVNYAVKGSFAVAFLETVPEVTARLIEPYAGSGRKSEDIIKDAQDATALILVLGDNVPTQNPDSGSEIVASLNQDNYLKAERLSREVLGRNPEDVSALFFLGVSLYKMGRFDEAIPIFQKAGFAAPRDQNTFSCLAGRILGLSYYFKWLTSHAAPDALSAVHELRLTLKCPVSSRFGSPEQGAAQNTVDQYIAAALKSSETTQMEALARLTDMTGIWQRVNPDGQTSSGKNYEYSVQQQGNTIAITRDYWHEEVIENEKYDAKLTRSGNLFTGYAKSTLSSTDVNCAWDLQVTLEPQDDPQYLKVSYSYLSWSGRSKDFCQGVMQTSLKGTYPNWFWLKRK